MHMSVMFLDRVLHKVTVPRNKLQLVAIACILIAAKFEETEEKVPTLPEMNRYAQWYVSHMHNMPFHQTVLTSYYSLLV